MFPAGLHPRGWNSPYAGRQVNFPPLGMQDFQGAGGGQDQKLQRQCRNTPVSGQLIKEIRHLSIRHGRMVSDFLYPRGPGKQLVQMTAPAGRIQGVAVLMGRREVQHVFDAPLDSLGRLGLSSPDR